MSNKVTFQRTNILSRSCNTNSTVLRNHGILHPSLHPILPSVSHQVPTPLHHHSPLNLPKREITESNSLKVVKQRRLSDLSSKNDNQVINTSQLNRNIEKTYLRSSSLKQASSIATMIEKEYLLTIQFISNWGHPNIISCSEIDILGKDRTPLPKVSISEYVHKDPNRYEEPNTNTDVNPQNLNLLCNHFLIKETKEGSWCSNWKPKSKKPFLLNINITSNEHPEYIRIWNSKFLPESNIRFFRVFYDMQVIAEGEVPINFCVVTKLHSDIIKPLPISIPPLCDPTTLEKIHQDQDHSLNQIEEEKSKDVNFGLTRDEMLAIFQENVNNIDCDKYGRMFVPRVRKLSFTLIESYDPNSAGIGLNSIELFDINGKNISFSSIKSVNILNGKCVSSPFNLFKDHRRTMDSSDMWICEKEKENEHQNCSSINSYPKLTVDLAREKKIVMIRIWNYNGFDEFNLYGVRKMRIDSDKGLLWRGVLNAAKGMTSRIVDGITDIWLTDKTPWMNCPQISEFRTSRNPDTERSVDYSSSRESTERSND